MIMTEIDIPKITVYMIYILVLKNRLFTETKLVLHFVNKNNNLNIKQYTLYAYMF